jgi:uncharacterized membrane protein YphA (DoxX/SURF4 family)
MKYFIRTYFSILISSLLGFIFILAAISKLTDMPLFQKTVQGLNYLPLWTQTVAVWWLPGIELVLGFCLLCRIATREASLIAGCLMVFFLWLSIHATLIGSTADCGCFKVAVPAAFKLTGWWIVARDFLLVLGCQYLAMHMHDNLPNNKTRVEINQ